MELEGKVILNRYQILSVLGEGAMGVVYLAEDKELSRQVALKVLRKELASRIDVQQRLQNECRILARLGSHPNIVTLYDRLMFEDSVILVMEYVAGEPLTDIIARSRAMANDPEAAKRTVALGTGVSMIALRPADALEIADQCLAALEFAHSKGILHRDIKPGNVLIARDHNERLVAKVMDFGIGKALASPSEPAMTAMTMAGGPGPGTPAYMAPEQIDTARFGPVDRGADLYAMGITLYEMLTFTLPFEGTYTELLHAHTNVEPPDATQRNTQVSLSMQRVLQKALKKDPRERYQSASDFRLDLKMAGSGAGATMLATDAGPVASPPTEPSYGHPTTNIPRAVPPPLPSESKKNLLIAASVAVLLVTISLGGTGSYLFIHRNHAGEKEPAAPGPVVPTPVPAEPVSGSELAVTPLPAEPPSPAPTATPAFDSSSPTSEVPPYEDRVRQFVKDWNNGNVGSEASSQRQALIDEGRSLNNEKAVDTLISLASAEPTTTPLPPVPTLAPSPEPSPVPTRRAVVRATPPPWTPPETPIPPAYPGSNISKTQKAINVFENVEKR